MAIIKKKPVPKKKAAPKKKLGRPLKWTDKALHKIGQELVDYVSNEKGKYGNWTLVGFAALKNYSDSWMTEMDKYPVFSGYLTRARRILGARMMQYGMEKNPNVWMLKTIMPRFLGIKKQIKEDFEEEELIKAKAKIIALKEEKDELKIILEDFMKEREG